MSTKLCGKKRKLSDDEEELPPSKYFRAAPLDDNIGRKCPYLDQIDRKTLDFDFEKVCSVTMINHNVYGCLVCGSYFAGRSKNSPAYFHSLQENHRIFIHLENGKIYCLPDDYEIIDSSLNDIKHNLYPTFTKQEIYNLDNTVSYSHALNEHDYLPGIIGLNNLNKTDWLNVIIQSLMRVKPLRNYFIKQINYKSKSNKLLVTRFGELVRKYFNSRNFKGQVSPHELLQAISLESYKKFQIGKKSDPLAFLSWFLNQLHKDLGGTKKHNSSIISKTFQGLITIKTYKPKKNKRSKDDNHNNTECKDDEYEMIKKEDKTFFYLLLDLPTMPLFKDSEETKFIPQIGLPELLNKFNGKIFETLPDGTKKQYEFARLPPYLLVSFRRFHENNFLVEKNSTIVSFILKGLDLKEYLHPPECDKSILKTWNVKKLRKRLIKLGCSEKFVNAIIEKDELISEIIKRFPDKKRWKTKYDLIAQICHEGKDYHKGNNRALIYHKPNNMWYEMQDLHVQEKMPQIVAISEAYIQTWARKENK